MWPALDWPAPWVVAANGLATSALAARKTKHSVEDAGRHRNARASNAKSAYDRLLAIRCHSTSSRTRVDPSRTRVDPSRTCRTSGRNSVSGSRSGPSSSAATFRRCRRARPARCPQSRRSSAGSPASSSRRPSLKCSCRPRSRPSIASASSRPSFRRGDCSSSRSSSRAFRECTPSRSHHASSLFDFRSRPSCPASLVSFA